MPWFAVTMSTVPSKLKRCGAAVSTCIYPPELHWQNVGLMSDILPPHWQEYYVGNDPTSWWRGPPIVHCESSVDMGYVWSFHLTHCMVAPLCFFRLCVFVGSILQLPYMLLTKVVCDHKWFLTYKYIYKFEMFICERKSFQKNLWVPHSNLLMWQFDFSSIIQTPGYVEMLEVSTLDTVTFWLSSCELILEVSLRSAISNTISNAAGQGRKGTP
jgi:hypothetical protein